MTATDAPARRATIKDVAARAGVSIKTVSRVMNNEPHVRPDMRDRVERVVAEMGYQPNMSARALASARTYLIGLLHDNQGVHYMADVQRGAMRACRAAGFHLVIEEFLPGEAGLPGRVRDAVSAPRLDGVLLPPPLCDNGAVLDELERLNMPCVRIAPHLFPGRAGGVTMDDRLAAAEMTRWLWEKGHRHIGFVAPPDAHAAASRRLEGYRDTLAALTGESGGELPPAYVAQGDFSTRSGVEAGRKLLALSPRPTAIFAANDEMAAGVILAAYQQGLEVPRDLSVAGFDDSPIAASMHPLLTTVRQPTAAMAETAATMLITRTQNQQRTLDFELVERDSVVNLEGLRP